MPSPHRRTSKIRKRKRRASAKDRKRQFRSKGTTPSLDKVLGPCEKN